MSADVSSDFKTEVRRHSNGVYEVSALTVMPNVSPEMVLGEVKLRADDVAVCARAGLLDKPLYGGTMCHIIRSTDDGAQMLSRFWLGQVGKRKGNEKIGSIEGIIGNSYLARKIGVPKSDAIALMNHATEEMGILAEFLPALYEAETSRSAQ